MTETDTALGVWKQSSEQNIVPATKSLTSKRRQVENKHQARQRSLSDKGKSWGETLKWSMGGGDTNCVHRQQGSLQGGSIWTETWRKLEAKSSGLGRTFQVAHRQKVLGPFTKRMARRLGWLESAKQSRYEWGLGDRGGEKRQVKQKANRIMGILVGDCAILVFTWGMWWPDTFLKTHSDGLIELRPQQRNEQKQGDKQPTIKLGEKQSSFTPGGSSSNGKIWSRSKFTGKAKPTGCLDRMDVWCGRNRGIRDSSMFMTQTIQAAGKLQGYHSDFRQTREGTPCLQAGRWDGRRGKAMGQRCDQYFSFNPLVGMSVRNSVQMSGGQTHTQVRNSEGQGYSYRQETIGRKLLFKVMMMRSPREWVQTEKRCNGWDLGYLTHSWGDKEGPAKTTRDQRDMDKWVVPEASMCTRSLTYQIR